MRQPASKPTPRAKVLTPQANLIARARTVQNATDQPEKEQVRPQQVPAATAILAANIVVPSVAPPAAAAAASVVGPTIEEAVVRSVLERYRGAYERLDAKAARGVWPSLDERRLARAFSNLESQTLDFHECRIELGGAQGVAQCRGRATFVGRVGTRAPQTQDRSWTFQLQKTGGRWAIDSVRSQ
ncbi:MAG: hypothetical protein ABIS29_09880 [Vicinamibacterales bacterium]